MNREEILKILANWEKQMKQTGIIQINFNEVNEIIESLRNITGKGCVDDPFKNLNDTLFRQFSLRLRQLNQIPLAIHSFKRYYDRCLELEIENNERMHKGDTLHWIGRYYYELRKYDEAFHFWILTYLEDILSEFYKTVNDKDEICIHESLKSPVSELLQLYLDIPLINLVELKNNSINLLKNEGNLIFNPEILKFKLRNVGHQTLRLIDYQLYYPTIPYLRLIHDKIKKTNDFSLWEQFATFLLSSIDGFEPITNLRPGEGTYEFDIIIRNCAKSELFISSFGDYIGVECKYFRDKKVNVKELDHFASKLNYHNMKTGIIFSNTPISGWESNKGEQYGKLVQTKIFNRNEIIIFDINTDDVNRILKGKNLIELIIEKYEGVRLGL